MTARAWRESLPFVMAAEQCEKRWADARSRAMEGVPVRVKIDQTNRWYDDRRCSW